jgi:hypothetical protein
VSLYNESVFRSVKVGRRPDSVAGPAGLPDISWCNMPKFGKIYQIAIGIMHIPNCNRMYQHYPVLGPSKYTKIEIFWFENLPSGNPKAQTKMSTLSTTDSNSSLHIFVLFFLGKKSKELANSFFYFFELSG